MKKLLFVISQLYKGGAETALVNLLNVLDYSKYEVDLVILNQSPAPDAVSLIPFVNKNVNLCDAYAKYQKLTIWSRIKAKLEYTSEQKTAFYLPALEFVCNKMYDWAFFVGEWYSPAFVAYHTKAKRKAAWIHCDLSITQNFDKELYFHFYECFDSYLFVSKNALNASVKKYPFLKEKAKTIYNVNDVKYIRKMSEEQVDDYIFDKKIPTLLTCANFRPEKNHIRQIKVMSELNKRGIKFNWINIGSTTNAKIVEEVKKLAIQENINDRFVILGAKENPYKYIKSADAVTVLSDYESWSMVITEAKIMGIPVIATKTAGALEQIEHNKTGILTDFDINSISNEIEKFLCKQELSKKIRHNLEHFDNTDEIITTFDDLVSSNNDNLQDTRTDRILYVIDDIEYKGGAHAATIYQIRELIRQGKNITIFSNTIPSCQTRVELAGVNFLSWRDIQKYQLLNRRFISCLKDKYLTKNEKEFRKEISYKIVIKRDKQVTEKIVNPLVRDIFSKYDIICVMSESSFFRKYVAESNCKYKIQWIHTDYTAWCDFNDWTRNITKDDEELYSKYDCIVLLSETIRNKFIEKFPLFKNKSTIVKNIMPIDNIISKGNMKEKPYPSVHFVSVGRLSEEKAFERLIVILGRLREEGYLFTWDIIGDGPLKLVLTELINQNGLEMVVSLKGHKKNPYKYIASAQVFALLSFYEGMPNTIYESLILGVPILATNVGGICEQVINGKSGWLVDNNENSIYEKIKYILQNQNEIDTVKSNLKHYSYDIETINKQVGEIFTLVK